MSSKKLKKWSSLQTQNPHAQGLIYANQIGYVTPLKRWNEWNVAGAGAKVAEREIVKLLRDNVLSIFDIFGDPVGAIDFLRTYGTQFNQWTEKSLTALDYVICFGQKADAERYFNDFIKSCIYKKRIFNLYSEMQKAETINLNHSEFADANKVKLAFVNGLRILT